MDEQQIDQIKFLTLPQLIEANASIDLDWKREISFSWNAVKHLSDLLIFDSEHSELIIDGDKREVKVIWRGV